jgi:16S rRNA processing protein RimM
LTSSTPRRWLRAGYVGSPHGLDGSFHVAQPNPKLIAAADTLTINGVARSVTRRAGHERRLILAVADCRDRDAAAALRGSELLVERSCAPALDPDEWWAEELEGCAVHDAGRPLGVVARLLSLPSCDVLEVSTPDGGELLVPLVSDAVRSVDVESREIEVDASFLVVEA